MVIGLAFQGILKDIIAGISLIFENSYNIGDTVTINNFKGEVIYMGMKSTKIKAATGEVLIINNGSITEVINHTIENSLAVVDGINYGSERIYDVPQDIKVNKTYHLKATIQNSICEVFLDNKKIISTTLIHPYTYGLKGIYVNSHADVVVKNFKGGKL